MTSLVTDTFERTCRTCLNTDGEMVSIFSPSDFYADLHLLEKLMAFTEIEISEDDDLPKTMCKKCMFLADSLYCFKKQCESSDVLLKSLISRNCDKVTCSRREERKSANVGEKLDETERDYLVEYVSEETRNDVENATRRRQEAERRIGMEKVSETIRNLKGIEVVPINEFSAKREGAKINRVKQNEDIVVFPVNNLARKRHATIETIVIDDPLQRVKRSKPKPAEPKFERTKEDGVDKGQDIVQKKCKKLNFTTVRKIVRIDKQKVNAEPDEEKSGDSEGGIFSVVRDDVVDLTEVNNKSDEKSEIRYPVIRIDDDNPDNKEGMKTHDNNCSIMQLDQFLEATSADSSKDIEKSGAIFTLEIHDVDEVKTSEGLDDHEIIKESTVGRIINEIDDHSTVDDNNEPDEEEVVVFTYDDAANELTSIFRYKTDKVDEISVKNKTSSDPCVKSAVPIEENDVKKVELSGEHFSANDSESNPLASDGTITERFADSSISSNEVKILTSESVNSSGKENRTINMEIYNCEELERAAKNSLPKYRTISQRQFAKSEFKLYQCTICLINFISMPTVLRHNIDEHMSIDGPFFCLICDDGFDTKISLANHVDEHNGSKSFKCTFCPKTFTLQRNLKRHVNQHINYKPYGCKVCGKRFSDDSSFRSHAYLHSEVSPFACKICNVSFDNKTNWRRHVITTHEKLTALLCEYCGKELPDKRSLCVHERVHTGERPYECPHCDKKFTQLCNLKTHIHCHLNDRPFGCPYCGKGFNQRGTRDDHILTHTGEKPHNCEKCDASFTVVSALKRHMWVHSNKDRPYNCDKCELSFVGIYDLKRHAKLRHGESVTSYITPITSDENEREKEQKEEKTSFGVSGESETSDSNRAGKVEPVQPCVTGEYGGAEILLKQDDSLYCRFTESVDVQTETKDHRSSSDKKTENLMNVAKKEELENYSSIPPEAGTKVEFVSEPDKSGLHFP